MNGTYLMQSKHDDDVDLYLKQMVLLPLLLLIIIFTFYLAVCYKKF